MEDILSIITVIAVVLAPIIWLIVTLNKKINKALEKASEVLNFQIDIPGNIFRKKKIFGEIDGYSCLLYTSPSPRDISGSRMPSSA